jgi:hypothetical protein
MECDAFVRQDDKKMKVVGALRCRTQNSGCMATGNRVCNDCAFLCWWLLLLRADILRLFADGCKDECWWKLDLIL